MNGKMLLVFAVLFSLFLIPSALAMNYYQTDFFDWSTGSNVPVVVPSFSPVEQTCTVRLDSWVDITGTYSATETFYSPDNSAIATTSWSGANSNCLYAGYGNTTSSLNNFYEAKINLISTGSNNYNYLRARLNCQTNGLYMNFTSNPSMKDSAGNIPLLYYGETTRPPYLQYYEHAIKFSDLTFKNCNANSSWHTYTSSQYYIYPFFNRTHSSTSGQHTYAFYYPFNTSSGKFAYHLNATAVMMSFCGSPIYQWYLYDYANPSAITTLSTSPEVSGEITLPENKQYVIMLWAYTNGAFCAPYQLNAPVVNYSVYVYRADWNCGAWSECTNGTQVRHCTDNNGITEPKNDFRACYTAPEASIFMGFEDKYSEDVFYCYMGALCWEYYKTKSVYYPTDWSVPQVPRTDNVTEYTGMISDNIRMSLEEAKDSDYSLKMWYLPPEVSMPYDRYPFAPDNNTEIVCSNVSVGSLPTVYRDWNESIFVERNITFPSPFMTLSFDTLKCKDNQIETKFTIPFLCAPFVGRSSPECCCYSYNESCIRDVEDTQMFFLISDAVNYSSPYNLEVGFQVTNQLDWEHHEYQMDNLQTNKTYRIQILIASNGEQDSNDYCAYVDNVNLNTRNEPVVCESYCDGVTRHEASCKGYVGDDCVLCDFTEVEVSPYCVSQPDKVMSCVNWCDCTVGNGTLYNASNTEYGCVWTVFPNNPSCYTECAQQAEESNLYTPYINATAFGAGNEWVAGFFTPILISLIIAIGISAVIVFKIPAVGWQGFIITFYGLLLVFSLVGLFPAWVYIIMIVFAGLIFASKFSGLVFQ